MNGNYFIPIILLVPLISILVLAFLYLWSKRRPVYLLKDNLFSPAEFSFYKVLEIALQDTEYKILAKIRLGDLFNVNATGKYLYRYWNKISSKHIDFLICNEKTHLVVIEILIGLLRY